MKVLTVCSAGICRSVGMAAALKLTFDMDSIAIGADYNSDSAFETLCKWADRIVLMEPKFSIRIPEEFEKKIRVCDVGPDRWSHALAKDLQDICKDWVRGGGLD